jgi:putative tricarboxylic transport membrane protein
LTGQAAEPERRSDRIAGAILLLLAAGVAWEARTFVVGFPADPVGPRALPLFAASILALGGVRFLLRPDPGPSWPDRSDQGRLAAAVGLLAAYPVLLPTLGFVATTGGAVTALSLLFGGPRLRSVGAAFLFAGGLYLLFVQLLGVPLPLGSLFVAGGD